MLKEFSGESIQKEDNLLIFSISNTDVSPIVLRKFWNFENRHLKNLLIISCAKMRELNMNPNVKFFWSIFYYIKNICESVSSHL
jgi:hypothetical protein